MGLVICGLATARPERSIEQQAAADIARTFLTGGHQDARGLSALFRRTGVRSRGSVLLEPSNGCGPRQSFYWPASGPEDHGPATARRMDRYAEEAVPLARTAAAGALKAAGIAASEISHIVTVSCTGFFSPGVDIALTKQLGLRPTVGRLHIGFMGCHGTLNGMQACRAIVDADPSAVVLLAAVELCSLHYQYGNDPEKLVANALFADGAAALVGRFGTGGRGNYWRVTATGSCILPDVDDSMTWRIRDHGFEMTLSPRVPELIARHLRSWAESWLTSAGLAIADVGSWAIHPGGPRILSSVAEALGLPPEATETSAAVLAEHGNMSSPTVLFVLDRLQRKNSPRPCVAMGFGPGLVVEGALIE
ncbi:MAG: type III polyketide synthase [Pirellulales bacterium]|nr:type III polyketide synthase [Pirellulales bacterium]